MIEEEIEKWIENTKSAGYIDCSNCFDDEEFNFIIQMSEELLKRVRRENGIRRSN